MSQKKRKKNQAKKKRKKKTWLIVMLNLRVNDTITMPTPAIAMETVFYCIDRLRKPPSPLKQVKCAVCTQPLPSVEPLLQLSLILSSNQLKKMKACLTHSPFLFFHFCTNIYSESSPPPPLYPPRFCSGTTSHLLGCCSSSMATAFCSSQLFRNAGCVAVEIPSKILWIYMFSMTGHLPVCQF